MNDAQLIELATYAISYLTIGGAISIIAGRIIHDSNDLDQD